VLPLALGVLYLTRPDALLLALGIVVIVRWLPEPKRGLSEALVLALLLGASLLVFEHYYGTPLPLPFYAKHVAFSPYDPHFIRVSNEARTIRFGLFLAFAFPLGLLALRSRDRENLALIGSVLLFCGYHYFATIDVMGMHGRFYAPALPVLALASARGIANAGERSKLSGLEDALAAGAFIGLLAFTELLPKTTGFHLESLGTVFYVFVAPAVVLACGAAVYSKARAKVAGAVLVVGLLAHASGLEAKAFRLYSDDDFLALQTQRLTVYRGLDTGVRASAKKPPHWCR
jgi:hypothetical protein